MRLTSDLEIPDPTPRAWTRSSTLRVENAVHVGLDDDGEQRPVDPSAPLEDLGEERTGSKLGDRQLDVAGLRRQQPRTMPVAPVLAIARALVGRGADHRRHLGFDERLKDELDALRGSDRRRRRSEAHVEQFIGIKLLLGHRCDLLVVSCWTRRESLRWSTTWWILSANYTNSGTLVTLIRRATNGDANLFG